MTLYLDGTNGISGVDGSAGTPALQGTDANTGISFPAADTVAISTDGSERVRCDSSGRVGIGTNAPTALLDLGTATPIVRFSDTDTTGYHEIRSSNTNFIINSDPTNADANSAISFNVDGSERARVDSSGRLLVGTSSASGNYLIQVQGNAAGSTGSGSVSLRRGLAPASLVTGDTLGFIDYGPNDGGVGARIEAQCDGTSATNDYPSRLVFSTTPNGSASPTERMSINSNGDTTIKTNGIERFLVNNNGVYLRQLSTTASAANVNVWTASSPTNLLLRSTSSIKYKTDVETLEDTYSDKILNVRPVWFRSTSEADNPSYSYWGFIAEEVAEIDPRLCFFIEGEDGSFEPDGVQYDRFVPHLLNLIKRQKEQIEALEARLTAAGI